MSDSYPPNITFDIARDALRRYLRTRWFLNYLLCGAFFGILGGIGWANSELSNRAAFGINDVIQCLSASIASALFLSAVTSFLIYRIFSHRLARRYSETLEVAVEGPFLRIAHESWFRQDRKIHFRALVDYTTLQGSLMRRFDIVQLRITTTGGGQNSTVQVLGLVDCSKVRDTLAEIDAAREQ